MKNVKCNIISGKSKQGKDFKAIQFEIVTPQGVYKSPLCFPTNLEIGLIQSTLTSKISDIYKASDTSETEDF